VWDSKSRVLAHCALTPWHMPDQQDSASVVAFVQKGALCIFDFGDLKVGYPLKAGHFMTSRT
jgi:hypothetical protein